MNNIKQLREFVFILCLAIVVMGLLIGTVQNDNTELTESNQTYQDSLVFLDSSLTATTKLYQIHAQINLRYVNKVCSKCEKAMRNDSEYSELIDKLN